MNPFGFRTFILHMLIICVPFFDGLCAILIAVDDFYDFHSFFGPHMRQGRVVEFELGWCDDRIGFGGQFLFRKNLIIISAIITKDCDKACQD